MGVVVILGVLAPFSASKAWAEVYLLDGMGAVETQPWPVQSRWIWVDTPSPRQMTPGFILEQEPVFLTELRVPAGIEIETVKGMLTRASRDEATGEEVWLLRSKSYPPSAQVKVKRRP